VSDSGFRIADLINNPELLRASLEQLQQQTEQVSQPPPYAVPVVEVPPPVIVHGSLRIRATFPHDVIVGQPYEALVQKVYDVLADPTQNNPWLPTLSISDLKLWMEVTGVERTSAVTRVEATATPDAGRVPEDGDSHIAADEWNPSS
jgi:hypothetical protein